MFLVILRHGSFSGTIFSEVRIDIVDHATLRSDISDNGFEVDEEAAESSDDDSSISNRAFLSGFNSDGITVFIDLNDVGDNFILTSKPHHSRAKSEAKHDHED